MKLALIFLAILVTTSYQQYQYQPLLMGFPWIPSHNEYFMPNRYYINYQQAVRRFYPDPPIIDARAESTRDPFQIESRYFDEHEFTDNQARIKGFGFKRPASFGQQQNGRFFFGSLGSLGSSSTYTLGNPLLKTVTLVVTSTCTALTVSSCIPSDNVVSPPVDCRKRQITQGMFKDDDSQFPVAPTEVRIVMPTRVESQSALPVPRQRPFRISSSKEDADYESNEMERTESHVRKARFLNSVWQGFATGVTSTSWFVTSITSTKTYIPLNDAAPPVAVILSCIPPGYIVCI